jgi:hypothetical protein
MSGNIRAKLAEIRQGNRESKGSGLMAEAFSLNVGH